ncbi:MAG: DNA polymerase III (beta subunit) [Candidatus Peregrinibacteria bacterium Gr01-1014_25]|nr:MAG: DNA polymerase III (beta subunit) [Candidatus Peregrinibacteria bacterium Gr01-1014_25]
MSATDLELSIVTQFPAVIENEGSITIPAKALLHFAQYTTDSELILETVEGTQLKCTSKHSKTTIAGEAATEFPAIAPVEKKNSFSLDGSLLLTALHAVTFACARSTLRPVLSGVYVRSEQGKLIFAATDSYRLSEYTAQADSIGADIACIIPVKVLEELRAAVGAQKGGKKEQEEKEEKEQPPPIEIILNPQQVEFRIGQTRLISRLIEGKFPDYRQIIPQQFSVTATLPVHEFSTVVKRMHYFAKEMNNSLSLHVQKKGVRIATPQTQLGKDEAELSAEAMSGEGKIALSSSYLLDFLNHIDANRVSMRMTDSMHPAVFSAHDDQRFIHLIMPLRMQEE